MDLQDALRATTSVLHAIHKTLLTITDSSEPHAPMKPNENKAPTSMDLQCNAHQSNDDQLDESFASVESYIEDPINLN